MKPLNQVIALLVLLLVWREYDANKNATPVDPGRSQTFRYLIVTDDDDKNITTEQRAAVNSARAGDIDAWSRTNCSKDTDGTPERRVWDNDVDTRLETTFWQNAMKMDHGKLPSASVYKGHSWTKPHTITDPNDLQQYLTGLRSNDGED